MCRELWFDPVVSYQGWKGSLLLYRTFPNQYIGFFVYQLQIHDTLRECNESAPDTQHSILLRGMWWTNLIPIIWEFYSLNSV